MSCFSFSRLRVCLVVDVVRCISECRYDDVRTSDTRGFVIIVRVLFHPVYALEGFVL